MSIGGRETRVRQPTTGFGIGASVKRREDRRLVTGPGRYAEDCNAPGQVYAVRALAEWDGAPGAVIHAILDALAPVGVAHIGMPATAERVRRAIRDAR
jgi:CO/xanthine dehydrogenase Mo-binding subunit